MPTTNPRVNVTLTPSLNSMLEKLSKLQRTSKAMILRELLEAVEPSLLQAVALMEAAEGASVEARRRIAKDMGDAVKIAEASALAIQAKATNAQRDLVADAETIRGRRPARQARASGAAGGKGKSPAAAKRPPSSNRGVKS